MLLVPANSWYAAYVAVALVSALPNLLLILIPSSILIAKRSKNAINFHHIMLSFAAAGLLGDVFLHTLPHLIAPHSHSHGHDEHAHGEVREVHHDHDHEEHDHEHDHHEHDHHEHDHHEHESHDHSFGLFGEHHHHEGEHDHGSHDSHFHEHAAVEANAHGHAAEHGTDAHEGFYSYIGLERVVVISLVLLLGFLVFMFAEKLASGHGHGHGHSHNHNGEKNSDEDCDHSEDSASPSSSSANSSATSGATQRKSSRLQEKAAANGKTGQATASLTDADKPVVSEKLTLFQAMQTHLQASGWLNLLADSMHNFTDGIAIGASFASGRGLAYATFLSVIFHEIPHEIGDFAILVQSGLSKTQAIQAQFVTALAAVLGTSVGLLAQRSQVLEELLLAFTAGGFLYLAAVNMLPTVVRTQSSTTQTVLEMLFFALGVGMMVLVTFME